MGKAASAAREQGDRHIPISRSLAFAPKRQRAQDGHNFSNSVSCWMQPSYGQEGREAFFSLFLFKFNLYPNGALLGPGTKEEVTLPSLSWWQSGMHNSSFRLVSREVRFISGLFNLASICFLSLNPITSFSLPFPAGPLWIALLTKPFTVIFFTNPENSKRGHHLLLTLHYDHLWGSGERGWIVAPS